MKNKFILLFTFLVLFLGNYAFGQLDFHVRFDNNMSMIPDPICQEIGLLDNTTGINDPSAVAQFDAKSGKPRGMLIPRMSSTDRGFIPSPADGLIVYDIVMKCFYYWDASANSGAGDWVKMWSSSSAPGAGLWSLTGTTVHPTTLPNNVGINTTTANSLLSVNGIGNALYGTYSISNTMANGNTGVFGESPGANTGSAGAYGVRGFVSGTNVGTGSAYGVRGDATRSTPIGSGRAYGISGQAGNATSNFNYGVYGSLAGSNAGAAVVGHDRINNPAWSGSTNGTWAGYFVGRGYFSDNTGINRAPTNKLEVFANDPSESPDAAARIEYQITTNTDIPAVLGINKNRDYWGIGVKGEGGAIGVYGLNEADGSNSGFAYIGVQGDAIYTPSTCGPLTGWGVYGRSRNFNENRGIQGIAADGNINYGVYGEASSTCVGAMNFAGYFNGITFSMGGYQGSDAKLKKNIKTLDLAIDKIMALRPTSYEYNQKKFDMLQFEEVEQFGFVAQELQEVFPNLVKESVHVYTDGDKEDKLAPSKKLEFLAINYTNLIPVLTKGIQEQQTTIEDQAAAIETLQEENEDLKTRLSRIESMLSQVIENRSEASTIQTKVTDAKLMQNEPNPFHENTSIRYFIPQQVQQASLQIADASGKVLKEIVISARGEGQTTLETTQLSSGSYYYTLVLDGQVLETKQMILE